MQPFFKKKKSFKICEKSKLGNHDETSKSEYNWSNINEKGNKKNLVSNYEQLLKKKEAK